MFEKKIMVEENAKRFVEATDKVMESYSNMCNIDAIKSMDIKAFELLQTSLILVDEYKELCLKEAKAIDNLTEMVSDLKQSVRWMDEKIDKLEK